ncbi:hypothetical protein SeLEV6574_g07652 [Synchytrium endobioticum]|uniref:Clathrin/coatomer adaptor adaptin-like N-terminal domain-containing protein n=1 Tax=Synchytrium endobioticum TaxID=286115 RepID=A0A507CHJ3_9FUNG|nr:hypothetical protein SeLEV6574_g07652 [Synchytrium endobioticum]
MRVLTSPDIDVRRKCLMIAMDMVSSRNVNEVVGFLKKELLKTHDQDYEKTTEYRQLLIHSIHQCAIKFSEVAANPILASEQRALEDQDTPVDGKQLDIQTSQQQPKQSKPVLADGTYASESAFSVKSTSQSKMEALKAQANQPLRTLVLNGDWFVGSVLATTLTKLTLRYASICKHKENVNKLRCEAMLIMTSII